MYSQWVRSYRDLPLLINQWANVVRWEMRTRLFLRTTEFLWQEGHTAHATREEAEEETRRMLGVYADFAINEAAIPVIQGKKSDREKFAGAVAQLHHRGDDGQRLGAAVGHQPFPGPELRQGVRHQVPEPEQRAGLRLDDQLGAEHAHGRRDHHGPRRRPGADAAAAAGAASRSSSCRSGARTRSARRCWRWPTRWRQTLKAAGVRVKLDDRDEFSAGFKFNDWEMRGVPLRIEIGPRDVEQNAVVFARRDMPGKEGKTFGVPVAGDRRGGQGHADHHPGRPCCAAPPSSATPTPARSPATTSSSRCSKRQGGFIRVHWAGTGEDEDRIKEETKATDPLLPVRRSRKARGSASTPAGEPTGSRSSRGRIDEGHG